MITINNISNFNLKETFDCGQCFRWLPEEDGSYSGIALGNTANMKLTEDGKTLLIEGRGDAKFWRNYLDLDTDYGAIQAILSRGDETGTLTKAIRAGSGIRILRQNLWETIVHFIISQNNNIPRIRGCIEKLCEAHGEAAGELRGRTYYEIPSPEKLAALTREDLAVVRLGYRDKYLIETAKAIVELKKNYGGDAILDPFFVPYDVDLHSLTGVGPKVEACIRLFGLHDIAAFPIDVWVKRLMNRFYGFDENDKAGMAKFAGEHFGAYAGLAQQYLFYYIREGRDVQ